MIHNKTLFFTLKFILLIHYLGITNLSYRLQLIIRLAFYNNFQTYSLRFRVQHLIVFVTIVAIINSVIIIIIIFGKIYL